MEDKRYPFSTKFKIGQSVYCIDKNIDKEYGGIFKGTINQIVICSNRKQDQKYYHYQVFRKDKYHWGYELYEYEIFKTLSDAKTTVKEQADEN